MLDWWIDYAPLPEYPSIVIQRNLERTEWLRLVVGGKDMSPFSINASDVEDKKWIKEQLEVAAVLFPDNEDVKRLLQDVTVNAIPD